MDTAPGSAPHPTSEANLLSNGEVSAGVYSLRFRRTFEFQPGQVVAIASADGGPVRYYSIASGNRDDAVEILYDLVPDGHLTPLLSRMSVGDRLLVSEPFGTFVSRDRPAWWIATGTGIAPFLSMVRSGILEERMLVHGGRTLDRFYYHDYLSGRLAGGYVCCCSSESAPWVYPGRLTQWLRELDTVSEGTDFMLCGGAGMVVEVRDLLIEKGVPFENIAAEIYF